MRRKLIQAGGKNHIQPTPENLAQFHKTDTRQCPLTEDILFNKRPEQLSVQEFIELTNRVGTALKEMKEETDKRAFNGFQP